MKFGKKLLSLGLVLSLLATEPAYAGFAWNSSYQPNDVPASDVRVDTTDFNNNLGPADINVQIALETLDDLIIGGTIGEPVTGGTTPAVLFICDDPNPNVLCQDPDNFFYTKAEGLFVLHESTVGFLQYPSAIITQHTAKVGSSAFGNINTILSIIADEPGAISMLELDAYAAGSEISHTSGTYTTVNMFRAQPHISGDGTIGALTYFRADDYINDGTETITLVNGLYVGFNGTQNYGYYNSGTASNMLGVTGSQTYQGSSRDVTFFYDTDGYWKFNQRTTSPLGMWINTTQGQFDFIHSGDNDPELFHSNSVTDTVNIGTDGTDNKGKLDIRSLITNRTALYIQYATSTAVPYFLIEDQTEQQTFQIRRGPSQGDDFYPQVISGRSTATIGAVLDSISNTFWNVNGYSPAVLLNSTEPDTGGNFLAGNDSGSPIVANTILRADSIFGADDSGGFVFPATLDVFIPSDWTPTSTEIDQFFYACAPGSIMPLVPLRLKGSEGVIINDTPTAYFDLRIKSPSNDYFAFFDVSSRRWGTNTSNPGATYDLHPQQTDAGIQVQSSENSGYDEDYYRALDINGNVVFRVRRNAFSGGTDSDQDMTLYIGNPSVQSMDYLENVFGFSSVIGAAGNFNTAVAAIAKTPSNFGAFIFGHDHSGTAVANTDVLGRFMVYGQNGTGGTDVTSLTFDEIIAIGNWSTAPATGFERWLYTCPTGTNSVLARLRLKDSVEGVFNPANVDYDFRFQTTGRNDTLFVDAGLSFVGVRDDTPTYELDANGIIRAQDGLRIGDGAAGVDFTEIWDGENSDGTQKWWEDEAYFQFSNFSNGTINTPLLGQLSGLNYVVSTGTLPVVATISTSNSLSSLFYSGKSSGTAVANNENLHQDIVYGNKDATTLQGNIYHAITADDSSGWATTSAGFRQDWYVVADGATTTYSTPAITIRQTNRVGVQQVSPNSGLEANTSFGLGHQIVSGNFTLGEFYAYEYNGTGGHTATLPTLSSTSARIYSIANTGTGNLTVDGNGSDGIVYRAAVLNFVLMPGESVILSNANTGHWITNAVINDVPTIAARGGVAGAIAATATVATATVGASNANYIVSANVQVTTSTTHNFSVQVDYTDETNTARTLTLSFSQLAGTIVQSITNLTGVGPYEGIPNHIYAKSGTTITVKTTGTFTAVAYNCNATIQNLG